MLDIEEIGLSQYLLELGERCFGEEHRESTLENYKIMNKDLEIAVREIKKFFQEKGHRKKGEGLTICGPKGTGKTHLLHAIYRIIIDMGIKKTVAINCVDIAIAARRAMSINGLDEYSVSETLGEIDILLIDDFLRGVNEKNSNFYGGLFYHLFNIRYINRLPTFIATNYDYATMQKILGENDYGEVIVDRIIQRNGPVIWLSGKSFRNPHGIE